MARKFTDTKTVPQTKFTTSDGRRFDTPQEANAHQLTLDFAVWYADSENKFTGNPNNANNVLDWLVAHKADVLEILQ